MGHANFNGAEPIDSDAGQLTVQSSPQLNNGVHYLGEVASVAITERYRATCQTIYVGHRPIIPCDVRCHRNGSARQQECSQTSLMLTAVLTGLLKCLCCFLLALFLHCRGHPSRKYQTDRAVVSRARQTFSLCHSSISEH